MTYSATWNLPYMIRAILRLAFLATLVAIFLVPLWLLARSMGIL